jgi:hypothetical protein
MQVKMGDRICLDVRARAEAIEDLLFHDYYSRTPRIRLSDDATPVAASEIVLDGNDVARLVECAIRHPSLNMRHAVLTAIWNHPGSFREIFRFGLQAPEAFAEIRQLVSEELGKDPAAAGSGVAASAGTSAEPLLPRMPLPAHLRDREKQ